MGEAEPPALADETRWYAEHTALLISTLKWSSLGAGAGVCVGAATRGFLWSLAAAAQAMRRLELGSLPYYALLPLALPLCVWMIRRFAPTARGHGTEAVIAAVHQRSGRIDWKVAPVKLGATVLTIATGGSVGKEGPCAQIGAALTSLFADLLRLSDADRRRLVICGIGAGFAAVFGTPISGALFGIEVLALGRIEYEVLFPCLIAGIVSHLVCGVAPPVAAVQESLGSLGQTTLVGLSLAAGVAFGLMALLLIESMRGIERFLRRWEEHPYRIAFGGGVVLCVFFALAGDAYAGLGTRSIDAALAGGAGVATLAFAAKIFATSVTLETGGSGGIVTPLFFIGATGGSALARLAGLPAGAFGAFGLIGVLAAAANTPLAAAVMGMELLPGPVGVYAALCGVTAYLIVGHRSVYASQKLGFSKSPALEVRLGGTIGEFDRRALRVRPGSLTDRALKLGRRRRRREGPDGPPPGEG